MELYKERHEPGIYDEEGGQEVLAVDGEDVQVCGLHWGTSRRQGPPGLSTVSGPVTGSG